MLTTSHYLSLIFTITIVAAIGIYTMRYVHSISDFNVAGRKLSSTLVMGSLVGAFIGGTSIMGTTQLAYVVGVSAIWFTLGGALSCILMALFLARPLQKMKVDTISQFLSITYGNKIINWVGIYVAVGMFLQVGTQILAAIPLLRSVIPISPIAAGILITLFLIIYIIFGGFLGASIIGFCKVVLLYTGLFVAALVAFKFTGGYVGYKQYFDFHPWFNLFPNVSNDIAKGVSVIIGFMSTQTYLQAVFAAKNVSAARRGLITSALLIVLIGMACVAIGMFMKKVHPFINPASALPKFLLEYLNPWFGGMVLATLLISIIMTGAALTLGICTILSTDVFGKVFKKMSSRKSLLLSRFFILNIAVLALLFSLANLRSMILSWAFLSMALRGVTVFIPLLAAIFFPKYIHAPAGRVAIILAPLATIVWPFLFPNGPDPLYVGFSLSVFILLTSFLTGKKKPQL